MNQKTMLIVLATVVVTLALAPKLRSLPVLSSIPTV